MGSNEHDAKTNDKAAAIANEEDAIANEEDASDSFIISIKMPRIMPLAIRNPLASHSCWEHQIHQHGEEKVSDQNC